MSKNFTAKKIAKGRYEYRGYVVMSAAGRWLIVKDEQNVATSDYLADAKNVVDNLIREVEQSRPFSSSSPVLTETDAPVVDASSNEPVTVVGGSDICKVCNGQGWVDGNRCWDCKGTGDFDPAKIVSDSLTSASASLDSAFESLDRPNASTSPVDAPVDSLNNGSLSPKLGIAARIAAVHEAKEAVKPTVQLTEEQQYAKTLAKEIEAARGNGQRVLVLKAGAGCGKTFELQQLESELYGNGQYTAFNAPLVRESAAKFVKAACNTTHSLAFREVGKRFAHRLGGARIKSWQVAQALGLEDFVAMVSDKDGNEEPRTLKAAWLAGKVIVAVRRFCQSAEREVTVKHFPYIDGIDMVVDGKRGYDNNDRLKEYLLPFAVAMWQDLSDPKGSMPFSHDVYVKIWQLGSGKDRPTIAADYILLDEAQDTAPVMLDVLQQQTHAMLILVGDDNQQIYEWRGAVNAMAAFDHAPKAYLSQSFRFGQTVADVANSILSGLEEKTDLVMKGFERIPSRICPVESPRCYLFRTNAGAVSRLMLAQTEGKRGHLIGGSKEVVDFCRSASDLQRGKSTSHPELGCFVNWTEVVEYSKEDEGADLRLMVKLIEKFGADKIIKALDNMPSEQDADIILSTGHRCVAPETLVETRLGVVRADMLDSAGLIGTADGPREYRNYVEYQDRKMLRITTENGYEVSVTDDHGMQAWNNGQYERVEARDLVAGQFLRMTLEPKMDREGMTLLPDADEIELDVRADRHELPKSLTPVCAFLFGALVADGTVFKKGVRYTKSYYDAALSVAKAFNSIGVKAGVKIKAKNEYMVEFHSAHVAEWLRLIGGMDPNNKFVPTYVMRSSVECQRQFIRGLFSDGTVGVRHGRLDVVSLTTAYPKMAFDVQFLLRRFGIVSRRFPVKKSDPNWHWRVEMYSLFARKFLEDIGFPDSDRTQKGLNAECDFASQRYVVPVTWEEAGVAKTVFTKQNARMRGYTSRRLIVRDLPGLADRLEFQHERIALIEEYIGSAVCVTVPRGARFLQNGFDGFNSKGREWSSVKLGPDWPTANKLSDSDRRLLYVACTRAQEELDLTACPTFCGGFDKKFGEGGFATEGEWIPGIKITYTVEMPTAETLESYRIERGIAAKAKRIMDGQAGVQEVPATVALPSSTTMTAETVAADIEFSWTKQGEEWCVKGPEGYQGKRVTVTKRSGQKTQETLRAVVKVAYGFCFYSTRSVI